MTKRKREKNIYKERHKVYSYKRCLDRRSSDWVRGRKLDDNFDK